ncbi:MAG: hypothetical protein ACSW8H_04075, partial [bacterium]
MINSKADSAPDSKADSSENSKAASAADSATDSKTESETNSETDSSTNSVTEETYLAGNPEEVAAVILFTNDVHTYYQGSIGYDGLALYKKELESQYDNVLLVDAGDAIQGTSIGSVSKGSV